MPVNWSTHCSYIFPVNLYCIDEGLYIWLSADSALHLLNVEQFPQSSLSSHSRDISKAIKT